MKNRASNLDLDTEEEVLVPGQSIVKGAKALADEEEKLIREVTGITMSKAFYANGTKMLDCGEDRAMELRHAWEKLPTVSAACDKLIALIAAEQRVEHRVPLSSVHVDRFGLVQGVNGALAMNENAWGQLTTNFQEIDPLTEKSILPARLRGNVNLWAPSSRKMAMFRSRNPQPSGIRECFAVLGSRYGKCDIDEIASEVKRLMPKDAHAETFYDGGKGQIVVSLAAPFDVEAGEVGVGRLHRLALVIETADDGTGSMFCYWNTIRIACINCTLVADDKLMFRRRHVGQAIGEVVTFALASQGEAMEVFAGRWREANKKRIADSSDGTPLGAEETFKRLVAHGYVKVPWVSPKSLVEKLMEAWHKEPGKSAAHINMAITRMAHTNTKDWKSPWVMQDLEKQAGELLYQQVHTLPALNRSMKSAFEGDDAE